MVLEQQEHIIPRIGRHRHIVTEEDLRDFIERDARIALCSSSDQGTVYWYPGAKAAGQYALTKDEQEIARFDTLGGVLAAYNFGYKAVKEPSDKKTDVHTRHCCLSCGCKYGDETCTVTTGVYKQEYNCTGECNQW